MVVGKGSLQARRIMSVITKILDITSVDKVGVEKIVAEMAALLSSGGIIALPTDTIYGIACSIHSNDAIRQVYDIKERKTSNPLSICVAEVDDMQKVANVTLSQSILEKLFPGQLTAVFTRKKDLNPNLNPETSLVGIRIPDTDFIRQLVRKCSYPIALTSANRSGKESTLEIKEFEELWHKLSAIVDGGRIDSPDHSRTGSTVIDFSREGHFEVTRQGSSHEMIIKILTEHGLLEYPNSLT